MRNRMKKLTSTLLALCMALGLCSFSALAAESNQMVRIDLWHAVSNQASMGNVATDNNHYALYNPEKNTLQVATNSVNVSGYMSAITAARYDTTGNGSYKDVTVLSTASVDTGTKNDGVNHTVTYLSSFEIELPSYIKKSGIEFIPFQMTVPYTPMDVVVGTGYLDARLRIDWSQVTTTTQEQIAPDTTMSSGSVTSVEKTDAATGIKLTTDSAKVASTTTFQVETVTSGADYTLARSALGSSSSFTLYKLTLISEGGQEVEPYGAITVTFPYTGRLSMYRVNTDGSKTELRGTAHDEGYDVMTRKIGLIAIVGGTKLAVATTPAATTPATATDTAFTDITGHWARESIIRATDEGLFNGTSATTFSPNGSMTNGMVVVVLYRMAGSPTVAIPASMPNVAAGAWYESACAWGYANGVIGGYTDFYPDQNVTRQGFATMLYKFYSLNKTPVSGADLSGFTDAATVAAWAKDGVAWANAAGIVAGTSATTLSPTSGATRAQIATMLCRYLDYTA